MVDDRPDGERFSRTVGNILEQAVAASRVKDTPIAIFGEMVALLWQRGQREAAVELEDLWNDLAHTHPFFLRCAYPLSCFSRWEDRELFSPICVQHSSVTPAESYSGLRDKTDRLRTVAWLQQAELALQTETAARRKAEARSNEVHTLNQTLSGQIEARKRTEDELRTFTRRLLDARDEEQRRVGRELHENIAQLLAALSLYLGALQEERASLSPRLTAVVESTRAVARRLLKEVSKISYLLHPPTLEELGLGAALRGYVDRLIERNSARIYLDVSKTVGRLPRNAEIALFRIVEEVLNGSHVRSGSASANIRLDRSAEQVMLEIHTHDEETPADKNSPSTFDVIAIRERARQMGGTVNIRFDHRTTVVALTLPIPARACSPNSAQISSAPTDLISRAGYSKLEDS